MSVVQLGIMMEEGTSFAGPLFVDIPTAYAGYESRQETGYADSDPVTIMTDLLGNYNLTAGSSVAPTFEAGELNGGPVYRFNGIDQYVQAASRTPFNFLHQGENFYVATLMHITDASPNAAYVIIDTGGVSTGAIGFAMIYDDRSALSRSDASFVRVSKGVAGFPVIQCLQNDDIAPQNWLSFGAWYAYPRVGDDLIVDIDGSTVCTDETANTPHAPGDATYSLNVGRGASGILHAKCDIAGIWIIKQGARSDADFATDITNLLAYVAAIKDGTL